MIAEYVTGPLPPPDPTPARSVRVARLGCLLAGAMAWQTAAGQAAETTLPVTPPGSTDVDQAILPPEHGLYLGLFALPYSASGQTYDSSGNKVPATFRIHDSTPVAGVALLYVYPFQLYGSVLGSTFVQPFQVQTTSIGEGNNTIVARNTAVGPVDAYSDIIFWSKYLGTFGATTGNLPLNYGLTLGAAYSMILPDGGYDHNHVFNLSGRAFVPDPNFALTYNTGPHLSFGDNTQLGMRLFYAIPQRNFRDGYHTGNIINLDWSVTEQFGPLRFGLSGYYQEQVTDDRRGNGTIPVNGNKFSEGAVGPVGEYFFPNGMFLKAKYSWTLYCRNFIDQQFFLISTGFKL